MIDIAVNELNKYYGSNHVLKGKANFYSGNYSFYIKEREQRYLTQAKEYKQQQKEIGKLEDAIKRQRVWAQINPSNAGLAKRALAMEKRIEHMDKVEKPSSQRKLTAEFDSGGYASKEIVTFDSVHKSYGSKVILKDQRLRLCRNDCIALVGANGCGKTSLIKMIMNEEQCDTGAIQVSVNVKPAYMPQIITFENEDVAILDILRSKAGVSEEKARSILARFNFRQQDVMKKAGNLSGGEKSRLKLCLMMQNHTNFLLLDEPTNHLDTDSREWMENALSEFDGTMLFVSHDRYFLSKFASKIWSMDNGVINEYNCGFDEYNEIGRLSSVQKIKKKIKSPTSKEKSKIQPDKLISMEDLIAEAETQLKVINAAIESDLSNFEYQRMKELYEKKNQLEEKVDYFYNEWIKNN